MHFPTQQDFVRLSRDRNFLIKTSLTTMTVSILLALVVSLFSKGDDSIYEVKLAGENRTLLPMIRFGLPVPPDSKSFSCAHLLKDGAKNILGGEIEASLENLRDRPETAMSGLLWMGLKNPDPTGALNELESLPPEDRHRNAFIADLYFKSSNTQAALRHYLAEAKLFDTALYARRSALYLAKYEEDRSLVRELLRDASFRNAFAAADLLRYHAFSGDYIGLARSVLAAEVRNLLSPYLVPALFTAAIWFCILMAFGEKSRGRFGRAVLAFLLGTLSASLTLYVVIIQETVNGFTFIPEDTPMAQFLYFLVGVALPEEFLKLLCFLPLAIWLRRKNNPLEVLVLGGMVGLGFAFQENLVYFEFGSGTFTAWLRLLTANALHFSLTGVAGYYLWRMLERPFRKGEEFLFCFLAVVVAHALYNAFLAMPTLASYAPLSPILVAAIAYQYFDPLRQHMEVIGQHRRLSPLGIFVIGSVVLTCTILVTSAAGQPFRFALGAFASSVAAMIPLAFAFINRFRDL